ncbi:MAG: DUF6765 family protein [Thermodesulfobacteriota bacterium]|nr:DUF6765 family protein [Thermodesulfobacteriota bacterium]
MNIEFHYFITFILSRKAGFTAQDAYTIAYASQYTDDNNYKYYVNFKDGGHYINEISQTFDITKPSEKRRKIYPLFHFIPGGKEAEDVCTLQCGKEKCFATVPNSEKAQEILKEALDSKDLYRIGIAVHAYADTWSHQNFLGYKCDANAKKGQVIVPNIGHADFFHDPDKIHNAWTDTRLGGECDVNNDERFLDAAKHIFIHLFRYNHPEADDAQAMATYEELALERQLKEAMDEGYLVWHTKGARVKGYTRICDELGLEQYEYDPKAWRYEAVEKDHFETDLFDRYWARATFWDSDWFRFQKAVEEHRDYALNLLEPIFRQAGIGWS